MKKKLFCFFVILSITTFFYSCSQKNATKDALDNYINAWNKNNYNVMYSFLSSDSKKAITEKDFIQKYKNIYSGIELSSIKINADYSKSTEKDGTEDIPFNVTMNTAAGKINFSNTAHLKKEKSNSSDKWVIEWSNKMIFPDLAEDEKVRIDIKNGVRGQIKDSKGTYLAENGNISEVGIVPQKLAADSKSKISQILNIQTTSLDKALSASYVKPDMFVPIDDISKDDSRISSLLSVPGVKIIDKAARVYPLKEKAAQLVGYVQKVTADDLTKLKGKGYSENDYIGKTGLEKIYENDLRAENGAEIYIVDKNGNKKKTIAKKDPKNGKDIRLTINADMQIALYNELKDDNGAGVILQPKTGEVLALVSTPAYDPNDFVLGMSSDKWNSLNNDPNKPLTNRFQGTFPPGSTFKPITAAIGLKTGKLDANAAKNITGLAWQKDTSWGNYFVTRDESYNESANLLNALVHSDNIYFAQTALDIGKDSFSAEVKNIGIGEKIPFEYGLTSSQFSSDDNIKSDTQLADSGYGQGEVLMNPVQLADVYTAFVNSGNIINPYLNADTGTSAKVWKSNVFSTDITTTIFNDLTQVVANPEGTGYGAYMPNLPLAGKTGTAEIKASQTDKNGTETGWFIAVNTQNPNLLVLQMAENVKNKGGSRYLVPKVKDIFQKFGK